MHCLEGDLKNYSGGKIFEKFPLLLLVKAISDLSITIPFNMYAILLGIK